MKSQKSLREDSRGVFGLTAVQTFFAIFLSIAILAYVMVTIFGSLQNANLTGTQTHASTAVVNETITNVNDTFRPNAQVGKDSVACTWDVCVVTVPKWTHTITRCLQEFTNGTKAGDGTCEYFTNGTYLNDAWWDVDFSEAYDGLLITGAQALENNTANLYLNYTLPTNVTNESRWVVSDGDVDTPPWSVPLTFTSACWTDAVTDQILKLRVASTFDAVSSNSTTWYCWNGADWDALRNESSHYPELAQMIYEEWMNWSINSSTNGIGPVLGGNWSTGSTGNCYVKALTSTYNNTDWYCTYNYTFSENTAYGGRANAVLANTTGGLAGFFGSVSPVYTILAILVIILVLVVLVRVVQAPQGGTPADSIL